MSHHSIPFSLLPFSETVTIIDCFPHSTSVRKLREYVRMVNYYHWFIPQIAAYWPYLTRLNCRQKLCQWTSLWSSGRPSLASVWNLPNTPTTTWQWAPTCLSGRASLPLLLLAHRKKPRYEPNGRQLQSRFCVSSCRQYQTFCSELRLLRKTLHMFNVEDLYVYSHVCIEKIIWVVRFLKSGKAGTHSTYSEDYRSSEDPWK